LEAIQPLLLCKQLNQREPLVKVILLTAFFTYGLPTQTNGFPLEIFKDLPVTPERLVPQAQPVLRV
jgi:hypothetical protein